MLRYAMTPLASTQRRGVPPSSARRRLSFFVGTADPGGSVEHFDHATPASLWVDVRSVDIGGLAFMWVRGNAIDVGRILREQHKDAASHPLYLLLKLNAVIANEAADMVLVDADRFLQLRSPACNDMWFVGLPRLLVSRWLPGIPSPEAILLKGNVGWVGLLLAYLRRLDFVQLRGVTSPFEQELMGEHIMSMLSFALSQSKGPALLPDPVPPRNRAQHVDMRRWIVDNCADPEMDAAKLARHFHSSVRHVHKVFASAGGGQSFLETVRQARLEMAARMLSGPAAASVQVAQVAYRCGFSDPAYFGLVFRKHYGCTPGAFADAHAPGRSAPCLKKT
jgi:AraC-like DNA-binding protein